MANIVWWEIETPDPDAFQRFHGALWGWTFEPAFADSTIGADYWLIRSEGQGIGGLQRAGTTEQPHAGTRVYWEVDRLEEVLDTIESEGGHVERRRTSLGGDDRWFAVVRDPTGVSLGLWTSRPA